LPRFVLGNNRNDRERNSADDGDDRNHNCQILWIHDLIRLKARAKCFAGRRETIPPAACSNNHSLEPLRGACAEQQRRGWGPGA
jgi:hypothetical protein